MKQTTLPTSTENNDEDQGHLIMDATIVDEKARGLFQMKVRGDEIHLFPNSEEFDRSALLRFFEFVCNEIDPEARIIPVEEPGDDS